jgi:inosine-uridine nucleoside N-ribohydrolase
VPGGAAPMSPWNGGRLRSASKHRQPGAAAVWRRHPAGTRMTPPIRLVIDTDCGIDDAVAIALACASPEVNLVAVITSYGNAPLAHTTRNVRHLMRLLGRPDIPVIPGADRPVMRAYAPRGTHGPTGIGYAEVPAPGPPRPVPNPSALVDVLRDLQVPVTLATLGPLTNLAHALRQDAPLVRRLVTRHSGMFGTAHVRGAADHVADFNAWVDPEAASAIVGANLPTRALPLDVTRRLVMSASEVGRLARAPSSLVRWLGSALRYAVESHRARFGMEAVFLHDVVTVAQLIASDAVSFERVEVEVVLDEGDERGHTRVANSGSPMLWATAVDANRMRYLLTRVFGATYQSGQGDGG